MGDTPSLLYLMDGNPSDPTKESWGGSFEKFDHSPRIVVSTPSAVTRNVAFCTIVEFRFAGPAIGAEKESIQFHMEVPYGKTVQKWPGYYLGNGQYALRYIPKKAEILNYKFISKIPELDNKTGHLTVSNLWPGKRNEKDYQLGSNWYTDKQDPTLYFGKIQGGRTVSKWRDDVLKDWAARWIWLNEK